MDSRPPCRIGTALPKDRSYAAMQKKAFPLRIFAVRKYAGGMFSGKKQAKTKAPNEMRRMRCGSPRPIPTFIIPTKLQIAGTMIDFPAYSSMRSWELRMKGEKI